MEGWELEVINSFGDLQYVLGQALSSSYNQDQRGW